MADGAEQISLGELQTNAKGGKFLPLRAAHGGFASWRSPDWLRVIWHPSSFGAKEQRRVNLCLEPCEEAKEFFGGVERLLVEELARKSVHDTKIFGKALGRLAAARRPPRPLVWPRLRPHGGSAPAAPPSFS
ncbi:unnamed protein product [Symbiodinium natans]|uniref:Uncharacterized protein n=1 Tax=Symbiodinium natans TaxID=878477 RepID=A0A812Q2Z2_9DINO|nr:unnamed protein product [Symbiodinium natans]